MVDVLAASDYVQGLWLGKDRRQAPALSVLDGSDFIVDYEGPRDFFARNLLSYAKLVDARGSRTVRINGDTYVLAGDSLLRYDETAGTFVPVKVFESAFNEIAQPWSVAFFDGMYYFARHGTLWEYIPASETWRELTGGDFPVDPYAVAVAGGRLVVLGTSAVYWSEVGNAVFTTDPDTGAGFILLAALGGGQPLALLETQNGFIAYTTRGAALFTVIDSAIPFDFRPIVANSDLIEVLAPINPFAIVAVGPSTHVMLTAAGLVQVSGTEVTQYDANASAFLRNQFLRFLPRENQYFARLWYAAAEGLFGVSLSQSLRPLEFDYALVRSTYTNQWGKFNAAHVAVDEFALGMHAGNLYNTGFVDLSGYVWYFSGQPQNEVVPDVSAYLQQFGTVNIPNIEYEVSTGTKVTFRDYIRLTSENVGSLPAAAGLYTTDFTQLSITTPGMYSVESYSASSSDEDWATLQFDTDWLVSTDPDEDWAVLDGVSHARDVFTLFDGVREQVSTQYAPQFEATRSYITYGPSRLSDQAQPDRLSYNKRIKLEVAESAAPTIDEDWLTLAGDEDWLTASTPAEDWGADSTATMQFAFDTRGTLDAFEVYGNNEFVDLEELLGASQSRLYFSGVNGIYHLFTVRADVVGHSYHIKRHENSLELAGIIT